MKKIIIYFPYDLKSPDSGSSLRPLKIVENFKKYGENYGIEIIIISGETKERRKKIKAFEKRVDKKDVLFCYMENSTMPFWLTDKDHIPRYPLMDIRFFLTLKKSAIPIGVFYRDAHWMFNQYTLTGLKKVIMVFLYKLEKNLYNSFFDKIFLPSNAMNEYTKFSRDKVLSLPPGADNNLSAMNNNVQKEIFTAIYVGGLQKLYGVDIMLKAFSIINLNGVRIRLIIICRENEFILNKNMFSEYQNERWLEIKHLSGKSLNLEYQSADIGIIPLRIDAYADFAVPVKSFEYLSFGLPVISSDRTALVNIFENVGNTLFYDSSVEGLVEKVNQILSNSELMTELKKKAENSLANNHLWINRVEYIVDSLTKYNLNEEGH